MADVVEGAVMDGSVSTKRDELTAESFEQLLAWLDKDRERAGEIYEQIRFQLIKIFIARGCDVSEELADQTINRVARKIKEVSNGYVGNPALYFYGVAKMIYLEHLRNRPATQPLYLSEADQDDSRYECLQRCVQRLTPKNRELILAYYAEGEQTTEDRRKELAIRMGLEPNALWVRAHRIREKLKQCVSECLSNGSDDRRSDGS